MESTSPSWHWILGTILAAIASFISNLGVALQKLQHRRMAESGASDGEKSYHTFMLWRIGLLLVILGSFADFAALNFAPQSLVAPLGSLTLVSNTLYSPLLLRERITKCDVVSTTIIIFGSVLTVVFAPHTDKRYTILQLFDLYARLDFAIYFLWVVVTVVSLFIWIKRIEQVEANGVTRPEYRRKRKLHQFLYPCISGIVGAQSVLFAKCTVELLANSLTGGGIMFFYWKSYVVVTAMFCSIYFQIKWLNDGLKRFDVSYCVPVFQSFWICVSVVSGMIFYQEYLEMSGDQAVLFVVAVLITIVGVVGLSQRSMHVEHSVALDTLNTARYEPVKAEPSERLEISVSSESGPQYPKERPVHSRTPSFDYDGGKQENFEESSDEENI